MVALGPAMVRRSERLAPPADARRSSRLRVVLAPIAFAAVLFAGCAVPGARSTPAGDVEAPVPSFRVGDRWVYRVDQRFRATPDYEETHEVAAIGTDGITVRVASRGGGIAIERVERWSAPGLVLQGALMDVETRRFAKALERFRFPMATGMRWNQWVGQTNETQGTSGPINRYASVQRSERITTPAGTFDALRLSVIMQLDDETPFRFATECSYLVWYAPAVRGVVREERRAHYREKGSGIDPLVVFSQNEVVELQSFTPGR